MVLMVIMVVMMMEMTYGDGGGDDDAGDLYGDDGISEVISGEDIFSAKGR